MRALSFLVKENNAWGALYDDAGSVSPSPSPSSKDARVRVEDVGILEQLSFGLLYAYLFIVRDVNKRLNLAMIVTMISESPFC